MPKRHVNCLLIAVLLAAGGCGGATFQPAPGAMLYKPLPRNTRILVAARLDQLPQPNAVLGNVGLAPASAPGAQDKAIRALVAEAYKFGCDALAEAVFAREVVRSVSRQRVYTKTGKVAYRDVVHERPVTRWIARCVRTSVVGFTGGRPAPPGANARAAVPAPTATAPAAAPAATTTAAPKPTTTSAADKRQQRAEAAAARKQQAEAERAKKAEEAAKQKAAMEARQAQAAKAAAAEKAREERLAKEAEAAARQREAAEAAEMAKQQKIAEEAAKVTARKNYEADAANARSSADPAVQVTFLVRWAERPECAAVLQSLQGTARKQGGAWITSKLKSTETEAGERPAELDDARLAEELKKAGAKDARFVFARSAIWQHAVRNPTSAPALIEFEANGSRVRTVVAAGKTATVNQTVPCGAGGAITRKRVRSMLTLTFGCPAPQPAVVTAMVPVEREMVIARDGLGDNADLVGMGKVLSVLPSTRAAELAISSVDAILAGRRGSESGVSGTTKIVGRDADGGMIDVAVTLRNNGATDVTVVFDAGTGRLTRLPVARKASETITLPMAATVTPRLRVKDVLPRMRTADWLVGHWRAGAAELLILPGADDGYVAFAIRAKGAAGQTRIVPLTLRVEGAKIIIEGTVPAAFAGEGLPAGAQQRCAQHCAARMTTPLTSLGKFKVGGARDMAVVLEAGGSKVAVTFQSKF